MDGFAGVVVLQGDSVLLVSEPDYFTGEPRWTFPSGHVEQGEDPVDAAARELAEESGCIIAPSDLELIAVADVELDGETVNRSWNYTTTTSDTPLAPRSHADEVVTVARWIHRAEAVRLLRQSAYAPKSEPALRFLTSGERHLHWTFDLVDTTTLAPTFAWNPLSQGLPT